MRYRTHVTIALGIIVLASVSASGAVPELINYQGVLADSLGNPLDTTVSMRFSIHDAPVGGTERWSETQNAVTVNGGLFNVLLGSVNDLHDSIFSAPYRYLEIQIGDDPETEPRQRLVTVAYAYRVSTVDGASGGTITGKLAIGPGHTNSGEQAFVAGESNEATGDHATVGGGRYNKARGAYSTVAGGGAAAVGDSNLALGDYSAIGGGWRHLCTGEFSTVCGGDDHTATGDCSVIAGGKDNGATAAYTTVSGGTLNHASALYATVAGGREAFAGGEYSFVAGGRDNATNAPYSFAAGRMVDINSNDAGSILFADSIPLPFYSDTSNEFAVRCTGGARFVTGIDILGHPNAGACLAAGSGSWASCSDRNLKINIVPIDGEDILARLADLDISSWSYRAEGSEVRHIGPMAQDFLAAFGVGSDERYITAVDADGVALAALQALHRETRAALARKDHEISDLRKDIGSLKDMLTKLQRALDGESLPDVTNHEVQGAHQSSDD
jgi:hypothetical protein